MAQATPEQSKLVRERRRVFRVMTVIWLIWCMGWAFAQSLLLISADLALGVVLFGTVIFFTAVFLAWRCPICGRMLGRYYSIPCHCGNCKTQFDT